MQMSQMGIQPDDLYRMLQGDLPQNLSQLDRPPVFHPNLSPSELEERIKQYKAWLSRDRELGPVPAPRLDRRTLLLHQANIREHQAQQSKTEISIGTTTIGFERHHSTTSLQHLERGMLFFYMMTIVLMHHDSVPISRMLLRKVHIVSDALFFLSSHIHLYSHVMSGKLSTL